MDRGSGYYDQELDDAKLICYGRKIYVPQSLHRCVIYRHRLYLNNPSGSRLEEQKTGSIRLERSYHEIRDLWLSMK